MLLLLVTPSLGFLRNFIKYRIFNLKLYLRTPLTYFILYTSGIKDIWKILIFERWFFFIYKSLLSFLNNDYQRKKNKYIKKYNLKY